MRNLFRLVLTLGIIAAAVAAVLLRYRDYVQNPWTRDGQVTATVLKVAPRVTGPIVDLPIRDNQVVEAGDILFRIDPRTYQAAFDAAQAQYDQTRNDIAALEKEVSAAEAAVAQTGARIVQAQSQLAATESTLQEAQFQLDRNSQLLRTGDIAQARFDQVKRDYDVAVAQRDEANAQLASAQSAEVQAEAKLAQAEANLGKPGDDNERLRAARANLESAQLDLSFTTVSAPVDGFVTNLDLRLGTQAVANQPSLALIDRHSFWVDAFFRETLVTQIRPGDQAVITLMSNPRQPLLGRVDSLGWGIAQDDGSTGPDLLPEVSPTFEWIRLAQRIPVRVVLDALPEGTELRVGQTASVMVRTGGAEGPAVAAPSLLQ